MSKSKELEQDALGNRMKFYEKKQKQFIDKNEHIIIRIDGKKFSKFTKGFDKPFDSILSEAMIETTKDLLKEFQVATGYTQSDEITLVIPAITNERLYNGNIEKLVSIIASTATIRFNLHLNESYKKIIEDLEELEAIYKNIERFKLSSEVKKETLIKINYIKMLETKQFKAVFDARAFGVSNDIEAFNAVLWRIRDAIKNSKSMFTQYNLSHKETLNMNGDEKVKLCLEKTGADWNLLPEKYKFGVLLKKEKFIIDVKNKFHKDSLATAERTRIITESKNLTFSDENVFYIIKAKL